ncbi:protein Shroom2 isoform X2 [Protopterus annectens]|uniref:protein Shroom2 isoform X2 n=1 Tax=Protopterus annectens TaxID=7888 RepID=UPI001CFC3D88|nr:protein Shroom2 isoform X2 [Protopterus annectens]
MGDEIIVINDVTLSGFRQEAICLVKGSHKTLKMVVKRRTEPAYRPHSWHSAKLAENRPEASAQQFSSTSDCTSWHSRCHASSSSHDLSSSWDQANFCHISEQCSSRGSVDSLDQQSHIYHHSRLSSAKSSSSIDHLENHNKRDSAYGSYSTNSSTPDHISSKAEANSAESMSSKLSWDTGHYGNGRHGQYLIANSSLENKHESLPEHYGAKHVEGSRIEEQPNTRFSFPGKSIYGPVWHVPEKKRMSCSSPPPQPPFRHESLATAKVHEKNDFSSSSVASNIQNFSVYSKPQSTYDRNSGMTDYQQQSAHINDRSPDIRRHEHFTHRADVNPYYNGPGDHSNNSSRLQASLSSTDVRFAQSASTPHHRHQHSDETTFFRNIQVPIIQKPQNAVCNSKILDTPSDSFQYHHSSHVLQSDSSSSFSNTAEQKTEYTAQNRSYYSAASKQPTQGNTVLSSNRKESWIPGMSAEVTVANENGSGPTKYRKARYGIPLQQECFSDKGSGKYHFEGGENRSTTVEDIVHNSNHAEQENQKDNSDYNSEPKYVGSSFTQQSISFLNEPKKLLKDSQLPEEESKKISPQSTPMLHSLATSSLTVSDFHTETESKNHSPFDSPPSRQSHKHGRFSTALRNEIQMKRAQLQKSRSAANLSGPNEAEEEDIENQNAESAENFTSSSDSSFSSTYIDNLKEVQARVLRATSFKRRDLEPVLAEFSSNSPEQKVSLSISSSTIDLSENRLSPYEVSKATKTNPTNSGSHIFRIGGRKRFSMEQKLKSYSEPEKMNQVGISDGDDLTKGLTSFADRRRFFEETSKPVYSKPPPKQTLLHFHMDQGDTKLLKKPYLQEPGNLWQERRGRAASLGVGSSLSQEKAKDIISLSSDKTTSMPFKHETSRLGTFAEYQASWKEQKKSSESKKSGRYRSADNILDVAIDAFETSQVVHERSRSSPSADFYGKDVTSKAKRREESSTKAEDHLSCKSTDVCNVSVRPVNTTQKKEHPEEKGPVFDQSLEDQRRKSSIQLSQSREQLPPPQENRGRSITLPSNYSYTQEEPEVKERHRSGAQPSYSDSHSVPETRFLSQSHLEDIPLPSGPIKKKGPAPPQRPPPPKIEKYRPQHISKSPLSASSESLLTIPSRRSNPHSPGKAELQSVPKTVSLADNLNSSQLQESHQIRVLENERQLAQSGASEPSVNRKHQNIQKLPMEASRSPSPQFAPQKLTDKPPLSIDDAPTRIEKVMENNTTVKMVPIKIVHSESHAEKERRQNFLNNIELPSLPPSLEKDQIKTLSTSEQSYSLFCAYTRQGQESAVGQKGIPGKKANETLEKELKDTESAGAISSSVKSKEKNIEDLKSEELAREIAGKDKSLADILDPSIKMKTTMDLMVGIFPKDEQLLEEAQQRRKLLPKLPSPMVAEENAKKEEQPLVSATSLTSSSAYYNISAPKAELLNKMKDMQQQIEEASEEELDHDLSDKKQELIDSISRKLQVLREARESLSEDIQANNMLGEEVEVIVREVCKSNEFDKFRMFIGDLDKIVNLLLSLSGRLARVENALSNLDENASSDERRTLTEKQKLLTRQHEDAKELKENLDRRERIVYDILANYLSEENLADYEHFVKMKSALIIEQRELEDKIKLGEEQLKCLVESLPSDRAK